MYELTRFITETPLWLTIIFYAVFITMWTLVLRATGAGVTRQIK